MSGATIRTRCVTAVITALVSLSIFSTDAWAPPGYRPAYRPPAKPYTPPARPYTPHENLIHSLPDGPITAEALKRFRILNSSPFADASHNTEGSKNSNFWKSTVASLGKATADISSAYVVVRIFEDSVLLTTNYLQHGYDDAPVLTLKHEDLNNSEAFATSIAKLTGSTKLTDANRLKIVLDKDPSSPEFANIFNKDEQTFRINTSSFSHAELYLKNSPLVFALERIDRPKPPPRWAAKLNDCCVKTGVPPDIDGWSAFGRIPLNRKGAQVISLFSDSKTSDMLARLNVRQHLRDPREIKGDPLESIRRLVESGDSSAPVVIIGHTEGSAFRVEGSNGFTLSFEALTQIAKDAKRPIFFLGCYTAEHFNTMSGKNIKDYPPVGTLNALYPREIVPKILTALSESVSMREFTERLSDENLDIWVSNNFLRNVNDGNAKTVRAPIYKRLQDGSKSIVGFLFIYIPCGLFGACK